MADEVTRSGFVKLRAFYPRISSKRDHCYEKQTNSPPKRNQRVAQKPQECILDGRYLCVACFVDETVAVVSANIRLAFLSFRTNLRIILPTNAVLLSCYVLSINVMMMMMMYSTKSVFFKIVMAH